MAELPHLGQAECHGQMCFLEQTEQSQSRWGHHCKLVSSRRSQPRSCRNHIDHRDETNSKRGSRSPNSASASPASLRSIASSLQKSPLTAPGISVHPGPAARDDLNQATLPRVERCANQTDENSQQASFFFSPARWEIRGIF